MVSLKKCLSVFPEQDQLLSEDLSVLLQEFYNTVIDLDTKEEHLLYRYYEELYGINIIILIDNKVYVPKCPGPYFWDYDKDRPTIIIGQKRIKREYSYEILDVDPRPYIEAKLEITCRGTELTDLPKAQHVDFEGKRRMVYIGNNWIESIGAPLNIPNRECINPYLQYSKDLVSDFYESIGIDYREPMGSQRSFIVIREGYNKSVST
jgi:hypothetical protein